ncbi:helix-turn-helix domain-containing protein [Clostridium sp. SYSU_GA19001]|uniref:PucR family transcriptional regulator n=1 Tax=Clostridium caldaquaticum TaxID=2940653 RepID=UPI002076D6CA|nr:helix-turn-helix domain-containing protein [Clostridium caldaquaticum]MCM8711255.1 helix-turn-helix domain-containing protein [Clostridium caldaquaticum]
MNISISMIVEKLNDYNITSLKENINYTTIKSVRLLEADQTTFEPDFLYVGKYCDFKDIINKPSFANLLIVCEKPCETTDLSHIKGNIIFINSNDNILKIFNKVQDIITLYVNWFTNLLEALFKDKGLTYILNIGQELLHNSIQVIDTSFSLLAYTNDGEVDDPEWNEHIKCGYNSYKNIVQLKSGKYIEKVFKSEGPLILHPPFYKNRLLMSNIIIDGKIIGHLAINECKRPFLSSDFELALFLSDIISSELNKNKFYQNTKGRMHEHLIVGLLNNEITDPLVIEEKIRTIGWDPKKNLHLLTFVSDKEDTANTPFTYIKNTLDSMIVTGKSAIFNDHIVMIIEHNKGEILSKEIMHKIEVFSEKNMLRCGLSRPFNDLAYIRKYYAQCLTAIECGVYLKRKCFLFPYEEYAIYHTFKLCMNTIDLKDLCHSAVLNLIEYDKKNNTKYTQSLYTYLDCGLDISLSAKKLFIHHNTMRFRIEKIQNILNIELNEGNLIQKFYYSYKVLEFLGEIDSIL